MVRARHLRDVRVRPARTVPTAAALQHLPDGSTIVVPLLRRLTTTKLASHFAQAGRWRDAPPAIENRVRRRCWRLARGDEIRTNATTRRWPALSRAIELRPRNAPDSSRMGRRYVLGRRSGVSRARRFHRPRATRLDAPGPSHVASRLGSSHRRRWREHRAAPPSPTATPRRNARVLRPIYCHRDARSTAAGDGDA